MSKLDDVLRALNKMLGGSALQKASELVKSVEIELEKPTKQGEKIPPRKDSPPKPPVKKQSGGYSHSFFGEDHRTVPRYEPINQRKEKEPSYRLNYQKLRQIGTQYPVEYSRNSAWIGRRFYEQAVFISQLNDNFASIESFEENFPYFMGLSLRQFRSYVSLRPAFLREDYSSITIERRGYLMLFFEELICGSAKQELSEREILEWLERIYHFAQQMTSASSEHASSDAEVKKEFFCTTIKDKLFDYALAHQMEDKMREHLGDERFSYADPKMGSAIGAYYRNNYPLLLETLSAITPYHICTTAVCKKEPYDRVYPKLLEFVLQRLDEGIRSNKPMAERLFGRKYPRPHTVFYPLEATVMNVPSFTMELYPWMTYRHDAQTDKYEVLTHLQLNSDWIAGILRSMDYYFRIEVGATKLKSSGTISISQDHIIEKAVHTFCEQHNLLGYETKKKEQQKKKKADLKKQQKDADAPQQPVKVEIDFSKLESIRQDAASVEARLLSVYEQSEQPNILSDPTSIPSAEKPKEIISSPIESKPLPLPQETKRMESDGAVDPEWTAFYEALDDDKRNYFALLVKDAAAAKEYLKELQKTTGKMPQLILEEINEIALEQIGDTVFETEGEIAIFEDYVEAAKRVFG